MISRGRLSFLFVSLVVVALLVVGTMSAASARERDDGHDSLYKYLSMFMDVVDLVKRSYVDETDPAILFDGAYEGTVDALDPFSLYVPSAHLERYQQSLDVGTRRSGLVVFKERGVTYAIAVHSGSPAATAGLERGDLLAMINGRSTREIPLWEIRAMLAGEIGDTLEIQRIRLNQREDVTVTLAEFAPPAVSLEVARGAAVLTIETIDETTVDSVATSLASLTDDTGALPGLERPDRLVIDLRDTAAGDAAAAFRVAGLFTSGELGVLAAREETIEVFASDATPRFEGSLAVLINRGTQGSGEVLAAVLNQRLGATLVGVRSFGHSGRPSLIPLSNGDRIQLTTAFYAGPDRQPIKEGLEPDVEIRPSIFALGDEVEADDPVLERALAIVLEEEPVEVQKAA